MTSTTAGTVNGMDNGSLNIHAIADSSIDGWLDFNGTDEDGIDNGLLELDGIKRLIIVTFDCRALRSIFLIRSSPNYTDV
jgi:hypothetical protein